MVYKQLANFFLEQSNDLIWIIDSSFCLKYANQAYQNVMKQVTGEEKKMDETIFIEGFGDGYIEKWKAYYERGLNGEHFEILEHFYNPNTHQVEYSEISFKPIADEHEIIVNVACQSRDITSFIQSNTEAEILLDASLDVICSIDAHGNFTKVNAACKELWGYEKHELIGKAYIDFVIEGDIEKTNELAADIVAGKLITTFENRYKRKDGGIAFNLWSARYDAKTQIMFCVARDAREKIRKEELLIESENRFKALVQEGSDLIAILDEVGMYTYVSPTSQVILGMDPEEFIGKNPFDYIHPDDAKKVLNSLSKITTENRVEVEPFRFQNKNGEWRWIETVLTNMLNNPAIRGIVANSSDITETVNIFNKLAANDQFNKAVIESSPDCLKILDKEGRLQYMNINGLNQMEIDDFGSFKNKTWWTLWGSENEELVKASLDKALKGETAQFTAFCPTVKGTPKWWDIIVSPVGKTGEPVQLIISVSRDITKQKEEEQRLKLLESAITNTSDAILITEAEPFEEPGPKIIYVNDAFTKMTGYTAEEVIGKTPRILQGPNSDKAELERLSKALRNWKSCEITTINYKKNGDEFWINFSVTPVADETGWYTHWIAIERDVTEQKIKDREKELLTDISINFNLENDYFNACKGLCQTIGGFGGFDWVELWTVNIERSKVQYSGHFLNDPSDEVFYTETTGYQSFEKGSGLPGNVWQNKNQVLWSELEDTKDFVQKKATKKIQIKTVLGIPLLSQNEVIGVLLVGSKQGADSLKKYTGIFANLHEFIGLEINRKKLETDLYHLYQSIPDIVCVADFQGRFLKMNPSGCHLLGYTEEEILYHNFDEFVYPADKDISEQEVAKLGKGQSIFSFENRYVHKNGEICWLSWTCNANSQEGIIYATARNITAEKKLRELNKVTSKMARIGNWEVDLQKNKIFWSEMIHQLHETDYLNFEPDLDQSINFYREDFRNLVSEAVSQCIQLGNPFDFEAVIVTANKNELWVRVIGNTEVLNGECIRIYGSFQDIHERKEADLRLQSLANNLPGVVFQYIIYPDGTDALKHVTKGAFEIWEYSPEEVMASIDLVWNQTRAGGNFEEVQQNIKESVKTKNKWISRYKSVAPSGKIRTLLGTGTPDFLADGTVLYNSVVLDITKEAQNEELLKQASDMAKIGSWELDLIHQENDAMYWSPMTREILEVDDFYNPSLTGGFEFYTEDSKPQIQQAVDTLIQTGKEFDEELLINTGTNKEKWIRCIGKSERVKNKCVKIFGSFQDIHASKSLEIKIREILESISDYFYALDGELNFTYMNATCANLLAVTKEKIIGKNLFTEFPDLKNTQFEDELRKVQNTAEATKFEFYYAPFDTWFEESIYPTPTGISVYFADITQRKKANAETAKSEEKRRLIMNGALDAIISIDTNETITFWNAQAEVVFGWKAEEVMGKPLSETIIPEPFRKYHVEGLKNYLQTGEGKAINVLLELSGIRRNGEEFPIELTVIPIKQGSEEFFCAFIRDITQRKLSEVQLIESEQKYRQLALQLQLQQVHLTNAQEVAKVGSWETDFSNLKLTWSDETYRIFGTDRESFEPTHASFLNYVHPDDREKVDKALIDSTQANAQTQHRIEHRVVTASGEVKIVDEHWKVTFGDKGEPLLAVGSCQDITERKKAEETILQANERFQKVTEATNDVIWDWDIESGTFFRSNAIDNFFGVGTAKILEKKDFWNDSFHKEDIPKIKSSIQEALEDPHCNRWEEEYRILNNNDEIIFVIDRGLILRNKNGKAIRMVGAMTNITEQKKQAGKLIELNQSLNEQAAELKRSNEDLEQFAFITSHDLQEPLRMISSFMDQLKRKYADRLDEKGLQYIHFATDGAKRMKQIILDLLLYSRANKPIDQNELINLNEIVSEYTQLRRKVIAEKSATITFHELPSIETYRAPITQIFHCLLDNALKYVDENKPPIIKIDAIEKENVWEFAIEDNGIGIDQKFFNKIFIIFQRLQNRKEHDGTGIGLAVAKRSVEFLGGEIWVESEKDNGSTFYFTIHKIKQLI